MPEPLTAIAAAAVTTSMVAVGSTVAAASKSPPSAPPSPPPANYISYLEDGRVTMQVWDASKNAYVTKTDWEDPEKKAAFEKEQEYREKLKEQTLQYLSLPPEDRLKAYEEYAQTYAKEMRKPLEEQYNRMWNKEIEELEARGMTGSRAYADVMNYLTNERLKMETDIADKAVMAKEQLAQEDRNYWLNVLQAIDYKQNADYLAEMQRAKIASDVTSSLNAKSQAQYDALLNANYHNWALRQQQAQNLGKTMTDTAMGLAFLYGMGKGWLKK